MRTCPECNKEYEGDFCPECTENGQNVDQWVHLTTAADDMELEILAGLLESAGIPSSRKFIGIDKYVGAPLAGLELMVPESRFEEAKSILEADFNEDDFPQGEEPEE
ncbi:MAG: DUF2007 domain-containing protein [Bacillota bacterium]|nr:DUF2007 domain-containing protein [Bacillota bacterium]